MSWKFVMSLILALIVAVFAIQNAEAVSVNFMFWKMDISQALIILLSAIFGALVVAFIGLVGQMRLKSTIRDDKKKISLLEDENKAMKTKLSMGDISDEKSLPI